MTRKLLLLLVALVLLSFSLAKSQGTGVISGVVRDQAGNALAGARIDCYLDYQKVATASSDRQGNILARDLIPGTYIVTASLEGYKQWKREKVDVKAGRTVILNIRLQPGILEEEDVAALKPEVPRNGEAQVRLGRSNEAKTQMMYEMNDGGYGMAALPSFYPGQLPPGWNTEDYAAITPNIFHSPLSDPLSTFSIDVDTATYSNVRRLLNQGELPTPNTVRAEEIINYFDYDYPQPKGETPFSVYTELGVCPWNQKRNLVHIGLQGKKIDMAKAPANNLVFLLDVSGSMDYPNKLPLVKRSMELLLENMRTQDRVAIVVYAGAAGLALPSTSGEEKTKISAALSNLEAGGTTAGGAGIQLAYKTAVQNLIPGGNNRVILCTDGDFNIGVSSDADMTRLIESNRNQGVFLTVLGFGMGNYKDNRLELLADKGNGNYAYIDDLMEAKKVLVNELGATLYTIAKDVKLQVEFNPAHVKYYRLIGYENRLLRDEDFRDDTKDAGELGAGHSVTAIYEIIPASSTEELPGLDPLKYQNATISDQAKNSPEVMTVKLRYKLPDGDTSIPLETPVYNKTQGLSDVSRAFGFSAAAVGYAMLLQESEFKGNLTWNMVRSLASGNMGADPDSYKKEFLTLIDTAQRLMESVKQD